MSNLPLSLAELEQRIAAVRENLTELTEQAAAVSGAAVEELNAQRIADQEAQLDHLTKQRDQMLRRKESIKPRMEVIGADGVHVGTVDRVEHGRIKLTQSLYRAWFCRRCLGRKSAAVGQCCRRGHFGRGTIGKADLSVRPGVQLHGSCRAAGTRLFCEVMLTRPQWRRPVAAIDSHVPIQYLT